MTVVSSLLQPCEGSPVNSHRRAAMVAERCTFAILAQKPPPPFFHHKTPSPFSRSHKGPLCILTKNPVNARTDVIVFSSPGLQPRSKFSKVKGLALGFGAGMTQTASHPTPLPPVPTPCCSATDELRKLRPRQGGASPKVTGQC